MRITSLGSGSSGNAYLVEAGPQGRTRLLVDAGFSARVLAERLRMAGCQPGQLRAVLVTHEHSDHILGLPVLIKRYQVPVFADPRTLSQMRAIFASGEFRSESGVLLNLEAETTSLDNAGTSLLLREEHVLVEHALFAEDNLPPVTAPLREPDMPEEIVMTGDQGAPPAVFPPAEASLPLATASLRGPGESGEAVITGGAVSEPASTATTGDDDLWRALPVGTGCVIGDIEARSFSVSHDAIAPCGYVLRAGGCRVCIVTDSGEVTPVMLEAIAQADLLILEANHDRERLIRGPYPYHLKQRILSPTGHLSNAQAAEAVLRTWRYDAVRWLWLAHLSRTNNTPRLALSSMKNALRAAGANLAQIHISALQPEMGGTWDSTRLWHDAHLWELPG